MSKVVTLSYTGNLNKTKTFLEHAKSLNSKSIFNKYGERGVKELQAATPKDTGRTADSWSYSIEYGREHVTITWSNSNVNKGENIALLLQYGHGTGTGGYVVGTDYINPAMKGVFDDLANELWEEVTK